MANYTGVLSATYPYTENDYDAIKEIRRLEKIVKAYRETDNDDEWNDDDEID